MRRQSDIAAAPPRAVIVMGVSGSGKSTLGALLAQDLKCRFLEADDFHSAENVAKMRSGQPLVDEDRWPWLDRLGETIGAAISAEGAAVAACSALKRSYRERLCRAAGTPIAFILLNAGRDELVRRLGNRPGHFMPVSLLSSQLEALEIPAPDEQAITLDAGQPPADLVRAARQWLGLREKMAS
ncbi:gluconokinase [Sphingomonas quercus]|uniref:gluconokinase n=1 Tax=Sphingomonas quercus TaxID=2842451 RepID=UPI003F4D8A70